MRQKASVRRSVKPGRACGYKARGNLFDGRTGEGWVGFSWEREDAWPSPFGAFGGAGKSRLFASKRGAAWAFRRSELAREGDSPVATVPGLGSAPLPNPLPEGRGDRWAETVVLALADNSAGIRTKPCLLSARTSPLSLQGGARSRGLGRGCGGDLKYPCHRRAPFASKLAPTETPSAQPLVTALATHLSRPLRLASSSAASARLSVCE